MDPTRPIDVDPEGVYSISCILILCLLSSKKREHEKKDEGIG